MIILNMVNSAAKMRALFIFVKKVKRKHCLIDKLYSYLRDKLVKIKTYMPCVNIIKVLPIFMDMHTYGYTHIWINIYVRRKYRTRKNMTFNRSYYFHDIGCFHPSLSVKYDSMLL